MKKLVIQKLCSSKQNRQHCFLQDKLRNRIPRVFFYFCSTERNSELFSLPRNSSEQNSKCLLLFLCHGTEFRAVFSSAEWFRTEFQEFASFLVPWYRISSIFLLCEKVRNRIPSVFFSAEQPEFHRNKPIVPSIPSSAE
jgi:hypothetical protein